jgi:hypothetical protein
MKQTNSTLLHIDVCTISESTPCGRLSQLVQGQSEKWTWSDLKYTCGETGEMQISWAWGSKNENKQFFSAVSAE